jgi:PAS domain S-box-containing protein
LIAEDDLVSRALLVATLQGWGHEVTAADDGSAAWDVIVDHSPDVAILDWMMPGVDGIELCRRVRTDPAHAFTYLILLTGRTGQDDVTAGLEAGADDYIRKPFNRDELWARLSVAKRILEANADSERLLASMSSVLIGLDGQGRINRWNSLAERVFAVSTRQAMGKPLAACGIQWSDEARVNALIQGEPGETHRCELRFSDAAGRERLLGITVTTMKQGMDGAAGRVVLGADITERRVLETQLRQSQKLEGIGQLAAGIAHEINTPMQYIGDNVRYLGDSIAALDALFGELLALRSATDNDDKAARATALACMADTADLEFLRKDLPAAVSQSLEGVEQVSRIVRAMKEFSHPGTGQKEICDLNHAIETTLVVARNEIKYVADVHLELESGLPGVPCLAGEINQVLLNLFVNAAHAIGDAAREQGGRRGTLTVSTQRLADVVEIRVADTGKGIPEAIRGRIFEPFFTTKDVGKGTGQGLAMAHATVVGRHGGQLWFDSQVGEGTTFFLRLPLQVAKAA